MKTRQIIISFGLVLALMSSCVIREPESKSELTKGGMQMFREAETDIKRQTEIFDIMLFLDSYIRTPDQLKFLYLKNNSEYGIRVNQNKYYFRLNYSDSLCVDFAPTQSMFNSGEEFFIVNSKFQYDSIRVKCIQKNKWKITSTDLHFKEWNIDQPQLNISCADTVSPAYYKKAHYTLTGNSRLLLESFVQDITLDYKITEPLVHSIDNVFFRAGAIETIAKDSTSSSNLQQTSVGRYLNTEPLSVEISIRGISFIYKNWSTEYKY